MTVQSLNPMTFPLHGQRLIEASAGTGKTFTIAGLYLRLLLGHGADGAAHRMPLSVENILVVTFTEAATQELRDRIRARIHDARIAFSRGVSGDPVIEPLLNEYADHAQAERLLLNAERQMDEAAIYTIHGFCQRMLKQNAFESGSLFSNEFITDEQPLRERAVADFWRRNFYPLPPELAVMMSEHWTSPNVLLREIANYLSGVVVKINAPSMPTDLVEQHQSNVKAIDAVKSQWLAAKDDILDIISQSGVDKRSYGARYLPGWIEDVTAWASSETTNYQYAKQLDKFSAERLHEKTKKGAVPTHPVFDAIETLMTTSFSFENAIIAYAIEQVRDLAEKEKNRFGLLSCDDLLSQLSRALIQDKEGILAERIRTTYPVAMIDEFQDTDPLQYHIFSTIYQDNPETGLFMIGDPKQAIYAFRGADIFTYIHARRHVSAHYNLGTNWRSTAAMVNSVNRIFEFGHAPFIYDDDIPFEPVHFAPKADLRRWELDGVPQAAMTFWLDQTMIDDSLPEEEQRIPFMTKSDYFAQMANSTAASIRHILTLNQQGNAFFYKGDDPHEITAGNIAVLVRKGSEADLIKQALKKQGIASVYMSDRNSVYSSDVAKDVLRILHAVLSPENERALKAALATRLFALTAEELNELNHNESAWEKAVVEFATYQTVWFSRGVLPMLRQCIQRRAIAERLLAETNGERELTDLLHLGELLQEASLTLESDHALVRWLTDQMDDPNGSNEDQKIRLESERDLVQIVTIHKSKGLEYDLVYMPFVCDHRATTTPFYHDETTHEAILDLINRKDGIEKAEIERLAEDLRLIYVALTRAVYGCFIGLGSLMKKSGKNEVPQIHKSAMGYLIQRGESMDGMGLRNSTLALIDGQPQMELVNPPQLIDGRLTLETQTDRELRVATFTGKIAEQWSLTSYSGLVKQKHHSSTVLPDLPSFDEDAVDERESVSRFDEDEIEHLPFSTIFQFPRGARPGTFLHTLFERVAFDADMYGERVTDMITHALTVENYEKEWLPVLQTLLVNTVSQPLNEEGMMLANITHRARLVEMEFLMPIERLQARTLNQLIQQHDPLSARAGTLDFATASGMLKGFIDLIFCWQGRYYVLDWKSNYLGDAHADYSEHALHEAMIDHRYDFQYQIYTLALHRFLANRLPDYSYEKHMGGVYYLFLRGIEAGTRHGIFYTKPSKTLVDGLDRLFSDGEA